jgi:hypothetical protein
MVAAPELRITRLTAIASHRSAVVEKYVVVTEKRLVAIPTASRSAPSSNAPIKNAWESPLTLRVVLIP